MFYYLYKITNLVNAKIYVGVHKTKNLDDGYMGSGKVIIRAINKHGADSFQKDILERFDTSAAMYAREKEVVTDDFLLREDVYNLRRGGFGGFDHINKTRTKESRILSGAKGAKAGGKRFGSNNQPNLGKMYITDGIVDKRVLRSIPIPAGWTAGRTNGGWKAKYRRDTELQK